MNKWVGSILILALVAGGAYWYMKEEVSPKADIKKVESSVSRSQGTQSAEDGVTVLTEKAKIELSAAVNAYQNGDYGFANQTLDQLLKEFPNNGRLLSEKGMTVALQGKTEEGIQYLQKALKTMPNDPSVLYNMAIAQKLAGNLEESKAAFEKVLEKDPKNTWSVYGIATILADQGRTQEALDALEKAIQLDQAVKGVAKVQDHFASFKENKRFEDLVK